MGQRYNMYLWKKETNLESRFINRMVLNKTVRVNGTGDH